MTVLWIIGLFAGFVVMTLLNTFWVGFTVFYLGTAQRLPYRNYLWSFFADGIEWILNEATNVTDINSESDDIIIPKAKDRIIRVCLFNKFVLDQHHTYAATLGAERRQYRFIDSWGNHYDVQFHDALREWEKDRFMNVEWTDIRTNHTQQEADYYSLRPGTGKHATFIKAFLFNYYMHKLLQFRYAFECLDEDGIGLYFVFY